MGYDVKQSQTTRPLVFLMVDSTDHITGKTGLSPTVTIRKNGGSFASPAGAVTEIANGFYEVAGNATDTETLGPLLLHATATGADPVDVEFNVVAYDPDAATVTLADGAHGGGSATITLTTPIEANTTLIEGADATDYFDTLVSGIATILTNVGTVITNLAAVAADVTTTLARLGAWTGSGRNTILGALQALFRKDADASVPSDINADLGGGAGTATNTTDSTEAIRDNMPTLSSGRVPATLEAINDNTTPVTNLENDYDGTGYAKDNSSVGLVDLVTTTSTATSVTNLASTAVAQIWDALTTTITTAGSIGKYILTKLGFITSATEITTSLGASTGNVFTVFRGEARNQDLGNPFSWARNGEVLDLTGAAVEMRLTRLDGIDDGGDSDPTATISGTIEDGGTAGQTILVEMLSTETINLALSPSTTLTKSRTPEYDYAYRFEVVVTIASLSSVFAEGRIIVRPMGAA